MSVPQYISRIRMLERLGREEKSLPPAERAWWEEHRISPQVIRCGAAMRYAVAAEGPQRIIFFDDEDEFGIGRIATDGTADHPGLCGDLVDAVRHFTATHSEGS
jgi:hypothetical protein